MRNRRTVPPDVHAAGSRPLVVPNGDAGAVWAPHSSTDQALSDEVRPSELGAVLRVLWHQMGFMAIVVAVVVGSGALYASRQTKIYESTAEVLVRAVNLSPTDPSDNTVLNTEPEKRIATSAKVRDYVAETTGDLPAPAGISISSPALANTLLFTSSSRSPVAAQRTATAYAEGYLRARLEQVLDDLQSARTPLQERIDELTEEIGRVQDSLSAAVTESARTALQTRLNSLFNQRGFLEQKLNELLLPENLNVGEILTPAVRPTSPARPNVERTAMLSLFIGVGVAVALAMVRDRFDRRLRDVHDVIAGVRAPVLAVVPAVPLMRHAVQRSIMVGAGASEFTHAFRTLRAAVEFVSSEQGVRSLLVTSPHHGDGKTSTLVHLAVVLARSGRTVTMVSADLERPDLRAYFMTHPAKGLTNALLRERNAVDSLEHVAEGLYLLDVGPDAAIASELLGSPVMGEVLEELEAECDMVLIDSAALLESADALSLAPLADATVLVVDAARVAVSDISQSRTMLERVGVHPVGAVLNNASRSQHRTAATRPEHPQLPAGASWSA